MSRNKGDIDFGPRVNARVPTLLNTSNRAKWRAGMRVGTISGVRRLGTVDVTDEQSEEKYGVVRGFDGMGTHVPVCWDDGSCSAVPRTTLEWLRPLAGSRVRHCETWVGGVITDSKVRLRTLYQLDPARHYVLVKWDGQKVPVPVDEKDLTVLWNADTTAAPLHGAVSFNNTRLQHHAKSSKKTHGAQ